MHPRRTALVSLLVLGVLLPLAAEAQQAARVPHLSVLRAGSPPDPSVEVFRAALRDLGYVEGRVDVILATQTPAADQVVE
jgi:hypothetical protein